MTTTMDVFTMTTMMEKTRIFSYNEYNDDDPMFKGSKKFFMTLKMTMLCKNKEGEMSSMMHMIIMMRTTLC